MTLIKKSNKRGTSYGATGLGRHYIGAIPVLEDPRSTSNQIYLFDDAHDKDTLNPIFNTGVSLQGNGGISSSYGYNYRAGNYEGNSGGSGYGHSIATAGAAVNICQNGNTGNDVQNNLDLTQFMSMDPNNPATPIKLWQNGNGKAITKFGGCPSVGEIDVTIFSNVGTTELSQLSANYTDYAYANESQYFRPVLPLHLDDDGYITGISARTEGSGYGSEQWYPSFSWFRLYTHPDPTTISINGTVRTNYNMQYIGASEISNLPIFLYNDQNTDYQQYIERINTSANTKTTLHSFTAVPTGGARSTASGLFVQNKLASTTFIDDDSDTAFYVPYFNTANDYQPLYFKWDKTTDVFTRSECTVSGDSSGLHFGNLDGVTGDRDGWSAAILNETFTYGSGRYVSIIPMNSAYQSNDATASARTIVTYAVDSAENSTLTHHSSATIPSTIKNILFLNDQKTSMAVALQDAVEFYKFTNSAGWSKTGNFAGEVHGIGRTIDGKIYMAVDDAADDHVSVHQISTDIPLSISVVADSAVYTYSGSEISTNLTVNALDYNNDRIASNITLEIDGSTIVFADSSSTKSITTSALADTTVPIRIVGAGFSNVITKIQV